MAEIKSRNVFLSLPCETLKIMCGAGVRSEIADGIFWCVSIISSQESFKSKKFGDGRRPAKSALPRNGCAGNTHTSATEESTGQKRCEKIRLLPSADATSQDSFLNPSDRSPWPEYLLRLIGMELEVPRCQYIAAEQGASAAFSVLLPK